MSDFFGRRLRAYRKLKHWTQSELAYKIGVSIAVIGSLERGTRQPTGDLTERLLRTLGVTHEEFFGPNHTNTENSPL